MERECRGKQPPGREMLRWLRVLYPVPGEVRDVVFLGEAPWGVSTHWRPAGPWGSARSVGCAGDECEWCGKYPLAWYGYLAALDMKSAALVAVAVSEERWHGLKAHLWTRPILRGSRWKMYNVRGSNAGWRTWSPSAAPAPSPLPPEPNLLPTLRRVYPEIAHLLIEGKEYLSGGATS